jgi:hypothetical protein
MLRWMHIEDQGLAALMILGLCCLAIIIFGCSGNVPTAPSDNSVINSGLRDRAFDSDQPETLFVASDTVSGTIDSHGGELVLHIQGKPIMIAVPAGALQSAVTITIIGTRYKVGTQEFYVYDCGPSGLQFAIPLELTQLINKSDGAHATLWFFDESSSDGDGTGWESIGVSTVLGGRGVFLLHHFSKYGISYALSQGGQLGDTAEDQLCK